VGLLDNMQATKAAMVLEIRNAMETLFPLPPTMPAEDQALMVANWENLAASIAELLQPTMQHIIDNGGAGGSGGLSPIYVPIAMGKTVYHGDGFVLATGQFSFDASKYTADIQLQVVAWAIGTAGTVARVQLYNLTDDEWVTGADVETTAQVATQLNSVVLTVGSAAGNLQDAEKIYEARLIVEDGVVPLDAAHFGSVCLRLEV